MFRVRLSFDEAARSAIEVSIAAHDKESNYAEAVETHDALHALLDALWWRLPRSRALSAAVI